MPDILSMAEAYEMNSLKKYEIHEIGSKGWKSQRKLVERMANQASINLAEEREEFIGAFLEREGKIETLVHELLSFEIWRAEVYPRFPSKLPMASYMYFYYEIYLLDCLTKCTYEGERLAPLGSVLVELCDYCSRQLAWLNSDAADVVFEVHKQKNPLDVETNSQLEAFDANRDKLEDAELRYKLAMFSISMIFNVVKDFGEKETAVEMSVANNLLKKNDFPLLITNALLKMRFHRRTVKKEVYQKYNNGQWTDVPRSEYQTISQSEGQAWLALHNLLCTKGCREKYTYDNYRKQEILKLERFLNNETLKDQLVGPLDDLQRTVLHLQAMTAPAPTESGVRLMVLEEVPEMREGIIARRGAEQWEKLARDMHKRLSSQTQEDAQMLTEMMGLMGYGI